MQQEYALSRGRAYFRKFPGRYWSLMDDFVPCGNEVHTDDWATIEGLPCEVFRLSLGGEVAQPTRLCELAADEAAVVEELPLAA